MSNKPVELTPQDIQYRIDAEGLGYAVIHYYGRDITCPEDQKLEELWKNAYDSMKALDDYVESLDLDRM